MTICRLSGLVGGAFRQPHRLLKSGGCTQLVLKGGRGSGKSSFAALEGIWQLLHTPGMHGLVVRKVGATLRNSVFAQYLWAAEQLGVLDRFWATRAPMELVYRPTGQRILFVGADDPGKLKSIRPPFGWLGFLHFEELDQFDGEGEVRSIEQSVLRGGERSCEIQVFNPPRSTEHWVNRCFETEKPGRFVHHSTYLEMPPEWLGERFLQDAEHLAGAAPEVYEHEYLGVANASGGRVFENLRARRITPAEIEACEPVYAGVDWGWYPDPWAYNLVGYNAARRELWVLDELTAHKKSNHETAALLRERLGEGQLVVCDSAEPKSVADYRAQGLRARAARKGRGSLAYSVKWLQGLAGIYVDPERCPDTYRELRDCACGRDGGIPDANNHHIDAVRYATERIWSRRGS